MTTKPAPREDERWNGLRWVDAKHMQLARFQEIGWSNLAARGTFVRRDGIVQPVPAPRFSLTTARLPIAPGGPGARTPEALTSCGIEDVDAPIDRGVHVEG